MGPGYQNGTLENRSKQRGVSERRSQPSNQRILVTTLKIPLQSRRTAPSNQVQIDVCRLLDQNDSQKYNHELNEFDDPYKVLNLEKI